MNIKTSWILVCAAAVAATACGGESDGDWYADENLRTLDPKLVSAVSDDALDEMRQYVTERVPRDTVSSTAYASGEEFDCVFIERQPTLEKMRREGRDISDLLDIISKPMPELEEKYEPEAASAVDDPQLKQQVSEEGQQAIDEYCPVGTVPVRRLSLAELVPFGSVENYLNRKPQEAPATSGTYEYANARRSSTASWGTRADVNLWSPAAASGDHSISQLWVAGGSGSSRETVEAGWVKRGSTSSRLFVYFTNSNYASGSSNCEHANCSCFNLDCGFVQTDNTVFLDAGWSTYSVSGGAQQFATLSLLKIYATDNWHFMYGNKWVGLWVRAMFDSSGIADSASRITFGGEVYAANNSPHTSTDMGGDGTFGSNASRWQHAAYQKLIKSIDTVPNGSATWTSPSITLLTPTRVTCYDHFKDATTDATWGTYMFHGGIGNHTSGPPSNYCQ